MSRFDWYGTYLIVAIVSGIAGWALVWPPLALIFVSLVAGILAAVDYRTTPELPEVTP